MISRIWHGWTTRTNAEAYEHLRFSGPDYEVAVVPEKARAVLAHFDGRSQHYELIEERTGAEPPP